jgi:hypothetical protein
VYAVPLAYMVVAASAAAARPLEVPPCAGVGEASEWAVPTAELLLAPLASLAA